MRMPNRLISRMLIPAMICINRPMPLAHAEMAPTLAASADAPRHDNGDNRARVRELVARQDVRDALQARGITPDQAEARVAALSDEEVDLLAHHMDSLPAGGDGILGLLFVTFVILLLTDIFGFTKVFPFTRSIK